MRYLFLLLVGLSLTFTSVASAQTTATIDASRDNSLYSEDGGLSNGAGSFLFTGRTQNGPVRRALISFDDFAQIPAGANVTSAQLVLTMSRTRVGSMDVSVHRVLADWGEAQSNAPNQEGQGAQAQSGDATWTSRMFPNTAWTSVGGDFESDSLTSMSVGGNGEYTFPSTPALVAAVNDWIANPSENFGVILLSNESATSAKRFNSRENSSGSPQLLLTFADDAVSINPSGVWFNPDASGDGFSVVYSTGDRLTFFFFGYTVLGDRLWLISDSIDTLVNLGQPITVNLLEGPVGVGDFDFPAQELSSWGTLQITFNSCADATYTLDGIDGTRSADVVILARLNDIECDDGL